MARRWTFATDDGVPSAVTKPLAREASGHRSTVAPNASDHIPTSSRTSQYAVSAGKSPKFKQEDRIHFHMVPTVNPEIQEEPEKDAHEEYLAIRIASINVDVFPMEGTLWKLASTANFEANGLDLMSWQRRKFYLKKQWGSLMLLYVSEKMSGSVKTACYLLKPGYADAHVLELPLMTVNPLSNDDISTIIGDMRTYDVAFEGRKCSDVMYRGQIPQQLYPFMIVSNFVPRKDKSESDADCARTDRIVLATESLSRCNQWMRKISDCMEEQAEPPMTPSLSNPTAAVSKPRQSALPEQYYFPEKVSQARVTEIGVPENAPQASDVSAKRLEALRSAARQQRRYSVLSVESTTDYADRLVTEPDFPRSLSADQQPAITDMGISDDVATTSNQRSDIQECQSVPTGTRFQLHTAEVACTSALESDMSSGSLATATPSLARPTDSGISAQPTTASCLRSDLPECQDFRPPAPPASYALQSLLGRVRELAPVGRVAGSEDGFADRVAVHKTLEMELRNAFEDEMSSMLLTLTQDAALGDSASYASQISKLKRQREHDAACSAAATCVAVEATEEAMIAKAELEETRKGMSLESRQAAAGADAELEHAQRETCVLQAELNQAALQQHSTLRTLESVELHYTAQNAAAQARESQLQATRTEMQALEAQLVDARWVQSSSRMSYENSRLRCGAQEAKAAASQETERVRGLECQLIKAHHQAEQLGASLCSTKQASDIAQVETHALHAELAALSRKTDVWRQRATQGAAAEAMFNVESWEVRRLTSELDAVRHESDQLQNQLRGTLQHSCSARKESQALECELRSLAQEASAWRHSAEAGASMQARLEAAGWLDHRALSELGSLRSQAQDLKLHLEHAKASSSGQYSRCNNDGFELQRPLTVQEHQPTRLPPNGAVAQALLATHAVPETSLSAAVRSSIPAVQGLHVHASDLLNIFETQGVPNCEIIRKTWHYANQLERINQRLAAHQKTHMNAEGLSLWEASANVNGDIHGSGWQDESRNGPTWARVVSQASCAEDQLRALASRLATAK